MAPSPRGLFAAAFGLLILAGLPGRLPAQGTDLPPVGFGSLRQDEVAVQFTAGSIAVRVLPLDEKVIRLLAPDTYSSLHELVRSRAAAIAKAARDAGADSAVAFIVTFYALQPQAPFSPDQLYLSSQNSFFRPLAILPMTPRWSDNLLDQRQQAAAIYLFDASSPVMQPFTVIYGSASSDAWGTTINTLASERARVLARAAQRQQP